MNVHADVAASKPLAKPPFRAEHIGSLLRPAELMAERARFARGEIDQAALSAAEDKAIRGAIRLQEDLGFKFVTDGEFRRRSYHSFFYRELGDLSIDTIGGADAKGAEGGQSSKGGSRGAQPVAIIDSRVRWSASDQRRRCCIPARQFGPAVPRSPSPAPARCISAAAMPRCSSAPIPTWSSSGRIRWRPSPRNCARLPMPAVIMCRSTRRPSPNSAIRMCRRRSPPAATIGAR